MKKVMGRKAYGTDTAELLHELSNGLRGSDLRVVEEELYRVEKGSFFPVGRGEAATGHARPEGDSTWTGGSGLRVSSMGEAVDRLEERDGIEALLEHF